MNRGDYPKILIHFYEIRLLDYVGFRPQLFECAGCQEKIQAVDQFFSAIQGGILCPNCGQQNPEAQFIKMDTLRYLRHFQRSSYQDASRAKISSNVSTAIEQIMYHYLTHVLEKRLNTPSFLKRMIYERMQFQ